MFASTLPAIPEPSVIALAVIGSVIFVALGVAAFVIGGAGLIRKLAAGVLLAAALTSFVTSIRVANTRMDSHRAEVIAAIEEHWQVTHVGGAVLSQRTGWAGEVDGEVKQCHTFNDDHLVVVCDGQEPATRR